MKRPRGRVPPRLASCCVCHMANAFQLPVPEGLRVQGYDGVDIDWPDHEDPSPSPNSDDAEDHPTVTAEVDPPAIARQDADAEVQGGVSTSQPEVRGRRAGSASRSESVRVCDGAAGQRADSAAGETGAGLGVLRRTLVASVPKVAVAHAKRDPKPKPATPEPLTPLARSVYLALLWTAGFAAAFVCAVKVQKLYATWQSTRETVAGENRNVFQIPSEYLDAVPGSTLVSVYQWTLTHKDVIFYVYHQHARESHTTRLEAWSSTGAPLWILMTRTGSEPELGLFTPRGTVLFVSHPHLWVGAEGDALDLQLPDWDEITWLSTGLDLSILGVRKLPATAMGPSLDNLLQSREPDACVELQGPSIRYGDAPHGARISNLHARRHGAAIWLSEVTRLMLALRVPHPQNASHVLLWDKDKDGLTLVIQNAPSTTSGGYHHLLWHACTGEGLWAPLCVRLKACVTHVPSLWHEREDCGWTLPNGTTYNRISCECVREAYLSMELAELGACAACTHDHLAGCPCWAHRLLVEELLLNQPCVQRMLCRGAAVNLPCVKEHVVFLCQARVAVHCWVGVQRFSEVSHATPLTLNLF